MPTLAAHIAALAPHFTFVTPPGDGPFPLVIQLHGCGGRKPLMDRWAAFIRAQGAAALIVDSYAPRNISTLNAYATVCTGLRLHGRERAADLYAAYAWARAQPNVDPNRIIAAGWSHGGWTVLDALALRMDGEAARATGITDLRPEPLDGLAGAFILYPYAGRASTAGKRPWRIDPHALAIIGGRDYIVGAAPRAAMERLRGHGARIDSHIFETATHAFDEHEAQDMRVRYDETLTRKAENLLASLIARCG